MSPVKWHDLFCEFDPELGPGTTCDGPCGDCVGIDYWIYYPGGCRFVCVTFSA